MSFERIANFQPDPQNANEGTERGDGMLDYSFTAYGAGRSGLADKHRTMIAGNKSLTKAVEKGLPIREVHTTGQEYVVVVRDDLDLDDPADTRARELAYADNIIAARNLRFNPVQLATDLAAGIPLVNWWHPHELADAMQEPGEPVDPAALWQGMPEFENEAEAVRSLHVHFLTEADCARFCEVLGVTITDHTKTVWYPAAPVHNKYLFGSDES